MPDALNQAIALVRPRFQGRPLRPFQERIDLRGCFDLPKGLPHPPRFTHTITNSHIYPSCPSHICSSSDTLVYQGALSLDATEVAA